jgi:hypothetical protein
VRIGALGKGDHRRGLSPSRSGREVGCRLAFCLVVEDIQFDVSRFRERCVKSFLRHHLSRGTACKPFTLVDPYLDPLRAEVALSDCIRRRRGGVVLPTSRKYRAIASLGVSLVQSSEWESPEQESLNRL